MSNESLTEEENKSLTEEEKDWLSIDWIPVPYSNEGSKDIKSACIDLEGDTDSGRRVVEVNLNMVSPDAEILQQMQNGGVKK